jgi:long-chain acyl-CoA synthetase
MMEGYYKRGKERFEGGWFCTGDLARRDEEGYFYIVDRQIDMIISGGENIYPAEIEEVLYSNPKILESAVIGIPDEKWGESVMAVVALKKGESANEDEIIEFCRARLAGYKIPGAFFLMKLPKFFWKNSKKSIMRSYWREQEIKV